jgi:phosphoglycolate phosphatase-like HAD superfamily hydrolase
MRTCAALYGYGKTEDMAQWQPDYWISHPGELCSA